MAKVLPDFEVTEKDLNAVDALNGQGSVATAGADSAILELKGALQKHNALIYLHNQRLWIKGQLKLIREFLYENFDYQGLPDGLTKYRIESKLVENGAVAIAKIADEFFAFRFVQTDYNIYDEPTIIRVVEPKSSLNNKEFNLIKKEAVIVRDNSQREPLIPHVYRYVIAMERVLYQIEQNITGIVPKGVIVLGNGALEAFNENGNTPQAEALEQMAQGERRIYTYREVDADKYNMLKAGQSSLFESMQFDDITAPLIEMYTFFKENLKELIGDKINSQNPKKERLTRPETDNDQGRNLAVLQHRLNVRRLDFDIVNETFGTSITIELQQDEETGNDDDEAGGVDDVER